MTDESHSFSTARTRLEEIVSQVRKKDTSLEKSLDLLEEGVRLANSCTELIDHQDWTATAAPLEGVEGASAQSEGGSEFAAGDGESPSADADRADDGGTADVDEAEPLQGEGDDAIVVEGVAVIEDVVVTDADGEFVAEVIEVREYEPADAFFDADDAWSDDSGPATVDESDDPSAPEG